MNSRRFLLAFIVLGLAASSYASYAHYRLLRDPTYVSACDVSARISCTDAYSSRFGTLLSVPVALLGSLWFVLALLVALPEKKKGSTFAVNADGYLFLLATAALSFILYLAYGAFFILKVVCPACLTTYLAVIGIFIVSGTSASLPMTSLPSRFLQEANRRRRPRPRCRTASANSRSTA